MKKSSLLIFCFVMLTMMLSGCHKKVDQLALPENGDTIAEIVVHDYGTIYIKLFENAAPKAVENFVTHAQEGYYNGQTFYRIIEDSLIESGDPTGTGDSGESIWKEEFKDEFNKELQPYYGALCMANEGPDTNKSQFFIVQASQTYDDKILDQIEDTYNINFDDLARNRYKTVGGAPWFYRKNTVFGQVYQGNDILDKISNVDKTDDEMGIPAVDVIIDKVSIVNYFQ